MTILFKEATEWSFDKLDHTTVRLPLIFSKWLDFVHISGYFEKMLVVSLTVSKNRSGVLTS